MNVGEVYIYQWIQCEKKVANMIKEGWELVFIKEGYRWKNHLMKKLDKQELSL